MFKLSVLASSAFLASAATCGNDAASNEFTIEFVESDGTNPPTWALSTNECPGYDMSTQTTPNAPTVTEKTGMLPADPVFCVTPLDVGVSDPVMGAIGYSLNGIPIYGPADATGGDAFINESETFDDCNTHPQEQGEVHLHWDNPCAYEDVVDEHSPVLGIMVDGIPIYGMRGDGGFAPADLDECNGHVDETHGFYHYHVSESYPYTVDCLRGLVPSFTSDFNFELDNLECEIDDSETYDYSPLWSSLAAVDMSQQVARASVIPEMAASSTSGGGDDSSSSSSSGSASASDDMVLVPANLMFFTDSACSVPAEAMHVSEGDETSCLALDFECDVEAAAEERRLSGFQKPSLKTMLRRHLNFADMHPVSQAYVCDPDFEGNVLFAECFDDECGECDGENAVSLADQYGEFNPTAECHSLSEMYASASDPDMVCDGIADLYFSVQCGGSGTDI